ncbi:MAG: hypothetical protein H8E13_11510 [Actinobacteria bacterium]|nr:hypothetical protein [Actinomycetota bacterium]
MKIKFFKIAAIIIGISVVGFLFTLPLTAATPTTESESAEEISESFDNDDIEEEFEGEYEDEDEDEPEEESGIEDEEDEALPGGGHEDTDGVDFEHEFEGVE